MEEKKLAASQGQSNTAPHEHVDHGAQPVHHHHSHAQDSRHAHGHHLLTVEDLTVSFRMYDEGEPYFRAAQRDVEVLHGLSISVHEGEMVAVVGASGSGKTLLADAVLGLFEPNAIVRGRIWFDGEPMTAATLAAERGRGIALVPQSVASLDPLMRVGRQVEGEPQGRGAVRRADAARRRERRRQLFARYGLDESVAQLYPHELSGGMARRVLLCCALMGAPKLIVADEPTPGLDLDLAVRALADLRAFADEGGGVMLITHDIELALSVADRVAVFRDGTVVEETAVANFAAPELLAHPFSRQLWHALPEHDFSAGSSSVGAGGYSDSLRQSLLGETAHWAVSVAAELARSEHPPATTAPPDLKGGDFPC
ncbi:ATP-binding cassette domain-containing protein [Adlercreutzia equolifaciens]|uniref:ATP-binding cassette domain-containing protein n=1 Tax=Adlercreutzia equolifaciens TaxID=446660 RepID=UPI0023B00A96|nr:ATP-binding cassette domain-containing protein [Adlercreutzia equolifaciens]MDE8703345.1 ATP-binding cassette domain-containing protein [Adlercreutzia equolifaciens]